MSPDATVVDLPTTLDMKIKSKTRSTSDIPVPQSKDEFSETNGEKADKIDENPPIKLSQRKKWGLLAIFSLAMFVDSMSISSRDSPIS